MAATTAVSFLCENLGEQIIKAASLSGAEEMIRFIEDELEWLNPVIESIGGTHEIGSAQMESIQQVLVRARDLVNTFTRTVSQTKMFSIHKKLKIRRMILELRRVQDEITDAKYLLSGFVDRPLFPEEDDQNSDAAVPSLRKFVYDQNSDAAVPSLRKFVFYFLLFPAGFKIPARRLIALWIAEGLIQPKKYEKESVEDIGEHYLNELIRINVVKAVARKSNGKVRICELNDNVREKWLDEAKRDKFLPDKHEDVRRLADGSRAEAGAGAGAGPSFIQILGNLSVYNDVHRYKDLISFLSFDDKQGRKERDDIGFFINKCIVAGCFKWLKVLDLERVFRPVLPETLGDLVMLKYLGLRWTYLLSLPEFVKGLINLEVLDVKHTYITILPESIWRMQSLRHLYLSEAYRTRFPRPISTISLASLQTLWGAFVDEDTCVKGGLDTLRSIRKLGLSCMPKHSKDKMAEQMKAIAKWISKLKFLESLRLKSRNVLGEPDRLHLTSLESNTSLSTVYLLGKLDPIVTSEFPLSLKDITLSGSGLDLDPLEFLERLPNLQALRLLGRSVMHPRIRCSTRGFPLLKVLSLWKLNELEEWKVEEGSLPCLEELDIRSCHNWQSPPDGLRHINKLKKFKLASRSEAFKDQSQKLSKNVIIDIIKLDQD